MPVLMVYVYSCKKYCGVKAGERGNALYICMCVLH